MTKEEIFNKLKEIFISEFELDESKITLDALVFEDLDLDSIDAVDIIVKMKQFLPAKINPDSFRKVRTVGDVVDILYEAAKAK